ncbi:helix-turn-helix domain-containing protein [Liquorilactobacillus vini]|uniref:helix-turn-helix domain-containing protein n=1 Tax=Liquorilactobacillus vini TaxID=238015 RepID=UPI00029A61CF|nr:Rgg/GadR/MutR family transcriptional regulator [Liquorilactobacillus vini]
MKTGELIRSIRTSKGIKAKTIYGGLLSRSMYYKYESGLVETTADTFLHILDRLNLGAAEFIMLFKRQNNEHTHYQEYHQNLIDAFQQRNINEIKVLERKIERSYQNNQLVRFYNLEILACGMKKYLSKNESFLTERHEIIHFLSRSQYWTRYEYTLLVDALFLFDGSSLAKLLESHEWFSDDGSRDIRMENLKVRVLCRVILLFMKTNRKNDTALYYTMLEQTKTSPDNVFALGCKNFFRGLKVIDDGDYEEGIKAISATFELYQKLGLEDMYRKQVTILQDILSTRLQESSRQRRV